MPIQLCNTNVVMFCNDSEILIVVMFGHYILVTFRWFRTVKNNIFYIINSIILLLSKMCALYVLEFGWLIG